MKKVLFLFLFILPALFTYAQPANDDCTTAFDLGPLPTPSACPAGVGNSVVINTSNFGATAPNPYTYQTNCNPSTGGIDMSSPANDVWYQFVATGYNVTIQVNGLGIQNPNVALWQGTCGSLAGRGCATSNNGVVSLFVDQLVLGNTYYIQISGDDTEEGDLYLTVNNNINCDNCMLSSSLTVNPAPVNGMYAPGQQVDFCYHVDTYAEVNTNWLHGVQLAFGAGWDAGSLITIPAQSYDQEGTWAWYPNGIIDNQGNVWPAGFYYDRFGDPLGGGTANDGNPGNNFGDHIPANVPPANQNPYIIPPNIWEFCWTVSVSDICIPGADLGITINTSGDGESGSWNNNGCNNDPTYVFNAFTSCCPPDLAVTEAGCDGNDGEVTATPSGNFGPYTYEWYDNNNVLIGNNTNVPGAESLSNLAPGNYSVHLTDVNNCEQIVNFTVGSSGTVPAPTLSSNAPICEGEDLILDASIVPNAQYFWSGPNGFASNLQDPTIPNAQASNQGVYSCYVVQGACTSATTQLNVALNPGIPVSFTVSPPVCIGQSHTITYTGAAIPGAVYNWNFGNGVINQGTGSGPYTLTWPSPGTFPVNLSVSANGCTGSSNGTAIVVANPVPGFSINPYSVSENNPEFNVFDGSSGASVWNYSISNGFSFNTPSFDYSLSSPGTYYITQTVTNEYGCSAELVLPISVRPSSSIFIPNAFTPGNNDNINDGWGAVTYNVSDFKLIVFDRWGEPVFSTIDPNEKWAGYKNRNRRELIKQDVYVYKVWYTDAEGNEQNLIGHVTVVR